MDTPSSFARNPTLLPTGSVVGTWRVEAWAGCGVHGAVYRAVSVHDPRSAPVALKLAMHPADPRFEREVELLSRCQHPSIPRLLDQGSWRAPSGTLHPFLVMQWVDGVSLYEQAHIQPPDSSQARRWLAQLAQALATLHAQQALHRDLKGDNIRVRRSDGRAMLLDFGTGLYPGAAPLTPAMMFPGTPIYRSPEAWLFEVRFYGSSTARYHPTPADDLYALGVTACRLLTGEYPQPAQPFRDEHGAWQVDDVLLPPALLKYPHIDPALRAFTLRLLSVRPEQRGTAAQLAEELEQTLRPFQGGGASVRTEAPRRRKLPRNAWRWGALAAAGLAVAVWAWRTIPGTAREPSSVAHEEASATGAPEAGTVGLGDSSMATALEGAPAASTEEGLRGNTLPQPVPGQTRADAKGRCPKGLVSLNGACWTEYSWESEACLTLGGEMLKGVCYVPFIPPGRRHPPTSDPPRNP
ncbi:serine/threonine-protein kinase [Hyalangium gracile]|uniref:serine/threonine-protein kinase n=1 Tax=Hyalangium gracile TaxID=394092 RepID=UPI001CC969C8|nr:serine/threonine-protein kinase [Hyalangium gracile]